MSHPERPRPLIPSDSCKTIPISIVLDGVEATGQIVFLNSTDLQVAILSPVSGFGTSLHVPWFAAGCASNWLAQKRVLPSTAHTAQNSCSRSCTIRTRATIGVGHRQNRGGRNVDGHLSDTTTVKGIGDCARPRSGGGHRG